MLIPQQLDLCFWVGRLTRSQVMWCSSLPQFWARRGFTRTLHSPSPFLRSSSTLKPGSFQTLTFLFRLLSPCPPILLLDLHRSRSSAQPLILRCLSPTPLPSAQAHIYAHNPHLSKTFLSLFILPLLYRLHQRQQQQ